MLQQIVLVSTFELVVRASLVVPIPQASQSSGHCGAEHCDPFSTLQNARTLGKKLDCLSQHNCRGSGPKGDTLLTEYFCGVYYPKEPAPLGLPPCKEVRDAVKSEMGADGLLPTLSLGDPAKPALFFVHGWPDSAAEFAAQFGGLCFGPAAKYRCVAATWQNFHPDLPAAPLSDLGFQKTIDMLAATVVAAKLVDTTFVIHDWGSFIGYQLMWQYPSLMNRTISFDIGSGGTPNTTYQGENALAWTTKDSGPSMQSAYYWQAPCRQCATWQSSWPYYSNFGVRSMERPKPRPPATVPLLFMWGNMTRGKPRESDSFFFNDDWLVFVESTPNGKVVEVEGDHWFFHQSPAHVNAEMLGWLESQGVAQHEDANVKAKIFG